MDLARWQRLIDEVRKTAELVELWEHMKNCPDCVLSIENVRCCSVAQELAFNSMGPSWRAALKALQPDPAEADAG